jgi:hypothetical protein
MRGPEDFGAAFTALLEAAGATPDSVVRALGGTVARSVLYDWKNGAHLPSDTRPLLEVVKLCLRLAGDGADLRGAPGDVEGWLNLLAEAKQSRDSQAAGGRLSLRGLDRDTLWQIANFLAKHAASLLAVLGELAASRPSDADKLIRRLEETKGRNQTPQCVVKPKILPAADLSVAYRRVDLLRTYRRALRGPGLADDRLLVTISALRGVLEEIYRVRIVFGGEKVPKRTDNTGSTTPDAPFDPSRSRYRLRSANPGSDHHLSQSAPGVGPRHYRRGRKSSGSGDPKRIDFRHHGGGQGASRRDPPRRAGRCARPPATPASVLHQGHCGSTQGSTLRRRPRLRESTAEDAGGT